MSEFKERARNLLRNADTRQEAVEEIAILFEDNHRLKTQLDAELKWRRDNDND